MSIEELNTTALDLLTVRSMIEELQDEAEALTDKLKGAMGDRGTEALQGDGWKATWKNITSSRLDTAALKKALPDVAAQFTRTTTTTRFVVSA